MPEQTAARYELQLGERLGFGIRGDFRILPVKPLLPRFRPQGIIFGYEHG